MKRIFAGAALGLLLLAHLGLLERFRQWEPRLELDANQGISAADLNRALAEIPAEYNACGLKEFSGEAEQIAVRLVGTDERCRSYRDFTLTEGGYFTPEAIRLGLNQAVVSRSLAERLWGADSPLGGMLSLNGMRYKVVGVYVFPMFSEFFGSGGPEWVYLPQNSQAAAKQPYTRILCAPPADAEFPLQRVERALTRAGVSPEDWTAREYTGGRRFAFQTIRIYGLFVILLVFVFLLFWLYHDFQGERDRLRAGLSQMYVSEYYGKNARRLIFHAVCWLCAAGLLVLLLFLILSFFTPPGGIPDTDAFRSGGSLVSTVMTPVQEARRTPAAGYSFLENAERSLSILLLAAALLEICLTVWLIVPAFQWVRVRKAKK